MYFGEATRIADRSNPMSVSDLLNSSAESPYVGASPGNHLCYVVGCWEAHRDTQELARGFAPLGMRSVALTNHIRAPIEKEAAVLAECGLC